MLRGVAKAVPPVQDRFPEVASGTVKRVADAPVSTFSIDVDTASYSFVRRMLESGQMPPKAAVRPEELINYFSYDYPSTRSAARPFKPTIRITPSPWNPGNKLVHIGIKGYELETDEKPRSNLVFLLDVSGSMSAPNRLPLVIKSLRLLVDALDPDDTVGIVTYAGSAGIALEPTKVSNKDDILDALDQLRAGGSTAGSAGLREAYALAETEFDEDAVNRVILATDGDFNVGISDHEDLKRLIEKKRKTGIYLSVLGFGQGNLNDRGMQAMAQHGNGNAAHIDTLSEARKVLVEEASSTLFPIAKDVKIQVEFNPKTIAEYRLIGYETRALRREDFRNDRVDAGDIGAGHTVTAIYEVTPIGSQSQVYSENRYQHVSQTSKPTQAFSNEYAFLKIRYKLPKEKTSQLISTPITKAHESRIASDADPYSRDVRWATAVAGFGQILKGDNNVGDYTFDDVIALARKAKGEDAFGHRAEFINLARLAQSVSTTSR